MLRNIFRIYTVFLLMAGVACYANDYIFPIGFSMFLLLVSLLGAFCVCSPVFDSFMSRLFLIIFCMPFFHGLEYINFSFDPNTTYIVGGLHSNPYTLNQAIMSRTFMIGLIGYLSLSLGILLVKTYRKTQPEKKFEKRIVLRTRSFVCFLVLGVLLSWLNAPKDTIFISKYTDSLSLLNAFNIKFNGAWLLSYFLLCVAYIDFLRDEFVARKWAKGFLFLSSLMIVVFYLQFMRGDRECMSLIAAVLLVGLLFVTRSKTSYVKLIKWFSVSGVLSVLAILFAHVVGQVRTTATNGLALSGIVGSIDLKMVGGTWSAALLSPVSVIGDFYNKISEPSWGQTYIDILYSLPPSFVAQALDYVRPFEGNQGPAWQMVFGIGGTHVLVIPFMNFEIAGVVLFMTAIGWTLGTVERQAAARFSFLTILTYACFIVVSPHWFWYGDMYFLRTLMAIPLIFGFYLCLPRTSIIVEKVGSRPIVPPKEPQSFPAIA